VALQAQRYLAAMSWAVENIAITENLDDLESLWMAYLINQKNLNESLPQAWDLDPGGMFDAHLHSEDL
jgi:hypothetical protein